MNYYYYTNIIRVSLGKNYVKNTFQSRNTKQNLACTVGKIKGMMWQKDAFQATLAGAECLRCSDAGWQSVPGTRHSDEERAVTSRRTT